MTLAETLRRSKELCRELRQLPGARDLAPTPLRDLASAPIPSFLSPQPKEAR